MKCSVSCAFRDEVHGDCRVYNPGCEGRRDEQNAREAYNDELRQRNYAEANAEDYAEAKSLTPSQTDSPQMDGGTPRLKACEDGLSQMFDGPIDQRVAACHFRELARGLERELHDLAQRINDRLSQMDGGTHGVSEHDPAATQVSWEEYAGQLEQKLAAMTEKMRGWAEAAGTATARNIQLERELFDVKADRYYSDRHRKAAIEAIQALWVDDTTSGHGPAYNGGYNQALHECMEIVGRQNPAAEGKGEQHDTRPTSGRSNGGTK